jgi:hypothetical protein
MKLRVTLTVLIIFIISTASFNNSSDSKLKPGCSGKGCHIRQGKIFQIKPLDNLQLEVHIKGVKSGGAVGGELLDSQNRIVDFINETSKNPFVLTAPDFGEYTINAGFKNPGLKWDTDQIMLRPTVINIPVPSRIKSDLAIYPNHPNPFSKETVIKFSLPKPAYMELLIFTENGKLVNQISEGWFKAGAYAIRWDGRDQDGLPCPSGIYLCTIKSDDNRIARRMVLAR